MNVLVHYKDASTPILYKDVENTYVKGPFFVVLVKTKETRTVYKHPVDNIWRVQEDYS